MLSLPDPALVVLVGAAGSGKSTWAAQAYTTTEVVSSDALRAIVGSGTADLDASDEAFGLLDQIVAARTRRRLTVVVDTLGLDPARRAAFLRLGRQHGLPCVAVVLDTPDAVCRERNSQRDRPVPAAVLTGQLRRMREVAAELEAEGWDVVHVVTSAGVKRSGGPGDRNVGRSASADGRAQRGGGLGDRMVGRSEALRGVVLQVGRFPWGEDPSVWLREVAQRADQVGFAGIALMDHLIQIPQVGRVWDPIPEPWVTLGHLAALDTTLRLGTLVSPVTFHHAGVLAKSVATLDVLSRGRAFCGLGAGWFAKEHAGFGIDLPPAKERLDRVEATIETMRALWAPGTKSYVGQRVSLPETTCYPRPVSDVPIVVGGAGPRSLRIAATVGDACNVPSDEVHLVDRIEAFRAHAARAGRPHVAVTVLDVAVVGTSRADTARRVERLRGRTPATTYAARHHAGDAEAHVARYRRLRDLGVGIIFLALPDLDSPDDLDRCAPLTDCLPVS